MAKEYDHKAIEKKWQDEWEKTQLYKTPDSVVGKDNHYTLVEFPYTSGDLHVGHWYAFAVPDAYVRMKRMQGYNVLYPVGFDTFGLPAENAAIKHNVDPAQWTNDNVTRMRAQLHTLGNAFDWGREVVTCDPTYYKWTQWIFLQFYKNGIAYRGKGLVNWDPVDKTILANEQVLPDGTAERSGAKVEKKEMDQWFFNITKYADRLIDDLDTLDWPESIKDAQRNWVGRSEGAEVRFQLYGDVPGVVMNVAGISTDAFTTRIETLFGATYLALAPEHKDLEKIRPWIKNWDELQTYINEAAKKSEIDRTAVGREKSGIKLEGVWAVNPATKENIPVFVADYVLASYGTGAVMGVPAHDERDYAFANKYNLPVVEVVRPQHGLVVPGNIPEKIEEENIERTPWTGPGILINSAQFDGLETEDAKTKIGELVGAKFTKKYKLRDWTISRQRYWGAPIPIVYDPEGKAHPIPEEHLPWLLPTDVDFRPTGVPPLARSKELLERTEKIFGKGWKPEVETLDGFVDNSWYFFRYLDAKNEKEFASLDAQKKWMPIARYSGGAEHTTVHVLYSRFFTKALHDIGFVNVVEPFKVRLNRGLILAEDGRKMSKRWGNVINPDEQVANVGADAVRTYLAFIGPYNVVGSFPWSTNGLIGVRRFLERVNGMVDIVSKDNSDPDNTRPILNQTIKKVGESIEEMKFNTAVSQMMIFANHIQAYNQIPRDYFEALLKLLAPFAPHITEELWHELGHTTSIHLEPWPKYDESKLVADIVTIAVQVGGKSRGVVSVSREAGEAEVLAAARADAKLGALIPASPSRIVFVPGRILNVIP